MIIDGKNEAALLREDIKIEISSLKKSIIKYQVYP